MGDIHPYYGFHATQECKDDDCDAQHYHYGVDVEIKKCRQCHRHEKEYCACLGEMSQSESERAVHAGKKSESPFEILIGGKLHHFAEQWHYDPYECQQHQRHHESLDKKYPVAGISGSRICKECHA